MINKMTTEELYAEKCYMQYFTEGTGNPQDKIRSISRGFTYMVDNPVQEPDIVKKVFKFVNIPNIRVKDCQGDIIPAFADKFNYQTMDVTIKTVADYLIANWNSNYDDPKTYIIMRGILYQCTPSKKLTFKKAAKLIDEIIKNSSLK